MAKQKIAISIESQLLDTLDAHVDRHLFQSRSQALEYYVRRGLRDEAVTIAIILLKGEHQSVSFKELRGKPIILHQLETLKRSGIKHAVIATHHTETTTKLMSLVKDAAITTEVLEIKSKGNAAALSAISSKISSDTLVMSGDIFADVDLRRMMEKHKREGKIVTMGLMTRDHPEEYGNVMLDGDLVVEFIEKPKQGTSYVVNAGVYIVQPELLEYITPSSRSLERDVFPELAKQKQICGFFLSGEYHHFS